MRCFGQQRAFEWAGGCWPAPHIFHAADPDDRAARRGARDWLGVCDREVGSRHDNMFFILQSSPCPLYPRGAGEARPPSRCRRRRSPQNEINTALGQTGIFLRIPAELALQQRNPRKYTALSLGVHAHARRTETGVRGHPSPVCIARFQHDFPSDFITVSLLTKCK